MAISYQAAGKTDVGCVRANNEDNFGYDERYGIHVVCDGMGGHEAGEVASQLAVETVIDYFRQAGAARQYPAPLLTVEGATPRSNALASAVILANQAVFAAGAAHAAERRMGSTIVAVLTEGDFYSTAHVGDSRIYRVRDHAIEQLTEDHSLVMEQVRRGLITREEAEHSAHQNIIVRALGSEDAVQPDVDEHAAQSGDRLLLCSDGLPRHLTAERILEIMERASAPEEACAQLIAAARDGGGEDNITCMIIRAGHRPWYRSSPAGDRSGGKPAWQNSF